MPSHYTEQAQPAAPGYPGAQLPVQQLAQKPQAKTSEEDLTKLIEMFEAAEESSADARTLSERDIDYYDNIQWTDAKVKEFEGRGQPIVTSNRIAPKVNFLAGHETEARTDTKAFAVTPQDADVSEAATDALRYIGENTDLAQKFSQVWDDMIKPGFGGVELVVDSETLDFEVKQWHWDRLFADPYSREYDYSDATFRGGITWMDEENAISQWPNGEEAIRTTTNEALDGTYDDKPSWQQWANRGQRPRVRIVQMYYKNGTQWYWCHFTKGGKLDGGPVEFVDKNGLSWCPLIMQSAFVDRHNNRYGVIRGMISPQDETNQRRSKSLHLLTVNQTWSDPGAVDDVDEMRREMARADGHIKANGEFGKDWGLIDHSSKLVGHMQLMEEAKAEIENTGPNAVLQGRGPESQSGRAKQLDQQGGNKEIARLMDRHQHFERSVYIGLWNLTRQYKKEKWWVRVTDKEDNVKFVGFNMPVTWGEEMLEKAEKQGLQGQELQAIEQRINQDERAQQVVRIKNVPAEMDMDIRLRPVPLTANVEQEQFAELAKLMQTGMDVADPRFKVLVMASSLRNKEEILEQLEGGEQSPQEQQAAQEQQEMQKKAIEQQYQQIAVEIEKTQADAGKIKADTAILLASLPDMELQDEKTRAETRLLHTKALGEMSKSDQLDGVVGNLSHQKQPPQKQLTAVK